MELLERFISNPVFIIFIVLMAYCTIKGAMKGMLIIIYRMISWIFLICFINYACGFVTDYINNDTVIPFVIQEKISDHLLEKYQLSEQEEEGSGDDAVLDIVPAAIKDKVNDSIQTSIDATITLISKELSDTAIHGISMLIALIVGTLALFLISKVIRFIGFVPGIRDVNRLLGIIAGFIEGLLITWLCMYLANCFSTMDLSIYIVEKIKVEPILSYIYENNIIERIIGI